MQNLVLNFIELFQESAPWLLLGLLIAGMMKWLVPIELLKDHMGKDDIFSVVKAALIGAPLPLCSCGVIPAAIGLRRAGASKPATVSFLVATPETGVDSISVSYALLGPFMAVIRPIAAIFSAIYVGLLTLLFANTTNNTAAEQKRHNGQQDLDAKKGCCSKPNVQAQAEPEKQKCCASNNKINQIPEKSAISRLTTKTLRILSFATGQLLTDITKWLLIGLLLAAAIKTWVPTNLLTQWGDGLAAMLVMALVGIPMYICATASTPIAVGFLAAGVSPGAVLVFMLAGPATNLSTMGMIREEMGNAVLAAYLVGILSASIAFGFFTNWAVSSYSFEIYQVGASTHQMGVSTWHFISAIVLALLMLRNLISLKPG
jgi:uncharacterized protein